MSTTFNITVNDSCISGSAEVTSLAVKNNACPVSSSVLRLDSFGRLEFVLSSSIGTGIVTAVAASRENITQATSQLHIQSGSHYWLEPGTLNSNLVVTASTVGAVPRDHMAVYVQNTSYMLTVANGGPAAGTIFSSSLGGSVSRCVADLVYDGTNWVLGSITRLV